MRFEVRKARLEDIESINRLYLEVAGINRTRSEYMWQWEESPAGIADRWVIVDNNVSKIIGHHGIMPFFFMHKGKTILAGKTENTMVLSKYRKKIIYPVIEKRLLKNYSKKYDIIFSSMGPDSVIRMRKGLGYAVSNKWIRYDIVLGYKFYFNAVLRKFFLNKAEQLTLESDNNCEVVHLSGNVKNINTFINNIWSQAHFSYGVTARRFWVDVKWRFFDNPYFNGYFFVYSDEHVQGYAVLKNRGNNIYQLEDIICAPFDNGKYVKFVNKIIKLISNYCKLNTLIIQTTSDNYFLLEAADKLNNRVTNLPWRLCRVCVSSNSEKERYMPRILGKNISSKYLLNKWYTTPFMFEGR